MCQTERVTSFAQCRAVWAMRVQVEDATVRRLGGVEAYAGEQVRTRRSLLDYTVEDLQDMLLSAEMAGLK
jgi:hypothetical protein